MSLDGLRPSASPGTVAVRLLQAACDMAGGEERLAERLNMSRVLLSKYMSGRGELPQHLLLRTLDVLLAEREARSPLASEALGCSAGSQDGSDLHA